MTFFSSLLYIRIYIYIYLTHGAYESARVHILLAGLGRAGCARVNFGTMKSRRLFFRRRPERYTYFSFFNDEYTWTAEETAH